MESVGQVNSLLQTQVSTLREKEKTLITYFQCRKCENRENDFAELNTKITSFEHEKREMTAKFAILQE